MPTPPRPRRPRGGSCAERGTGGDGFHTRAVTAVIAVRPAYRVHSRQDSPPEEVDGMKRFIVVILTVLVLAAALGAALAVNAADGARGGGGIELLTP